MSVLDDRVDVDEGSHDVDDVIEVISVCKEGTISPREKSSYYIHEPGQKLSDGRHLSTW